MGCFFWAFVILLAGADLPLLDDSPPKPGEWGIRPVEGVSLRMTPPGFTWRDHPLASSYDLEVEGKDGKKAYRDISLNVFCPPLPLAPGAYTWKYRYRDEKGNTSPWSRSRAFTVMEDARAFPLPSREELLSRIPVAHPRLFARPEEIPALREEARGKRKEAFRKLKEACEKILKNPPPTKEPPRYGKNIVRKSEEWRKIWWGNRTYTIKVLESAALMAFTGLIAENDDYRASAKRLLLDAAAWDPKGATGYRYNDEAGMPYAYHFSRAYTWLHDYLAEEERETCRKVMKVRGEEMYGHLCPRHLTRPFGSHANRAWHFLGEVGIAFHGEIPEAADWVWFAANTFRCVYPVWCDEDGGWHEGMAYWRSYISRFTWWAQVMEKAMGVSAFEKAYFSQIGYYPLYMTPPGQRGGGFGDLAPKVDSEDSVPLMAFFAAHARNPHWQWYVEAHGGAPEPKGYIGYLSGSLPEVEAVPPKDLPSSRHFRGTEQSVLNATLLDAKENVQVLFKSSPFGTQSHGYEAQNAFQVNVFGEPLLIRTGRRDIHGSAHHTKWMWETKSVNSILVDGKGQIKHTQSVGGKIIDFFTSDHIDYVAGEAGEAYGDLLEKFTRRILFVKPDLIVIFDTVIPPSDCELTWCLHSPYEMKRENQWNITVEGKEGAARITFLLPGDLELVQTDAFDPPPRPRIKLEQWHLWATRPEGSFWNDFVTVIRPYRKGEWPRIIKYDLSWEATEDGYELQSAAESGKVHVFMEPGGLEKNSSVECEILDDQGVMVASFRSDGV